MGNGFPFGMTFSTIISFCFWQQSNGFLSENTFETRVPCRTGQPLLHPRRHSYEGEMLTSAAVVQTATVDYSAANEYVRAHYNQSQYFDHAVGGSSAEHLHDGRTLQSCYNDDREMLSDNGLAIIKSPMTKEPKWSELEDVQENYLPELEAIVHRLFPSKLLHCCFWNPMLRGESYEISREGGDAANTPTANVASLAHIDTDVGAYDSIRDFMEIVDKNRVRSSNSPNATAFEDVVDGIVRGKKRFAVVNFWRNVGDAPVASAPLAILSTRYDAPHLAFPDARPDMTKSRWYVFPNATRDEVIVFYQYDRSLAQPSDLWHCAVSARDGGTEPKGVRRSPPRKSFDVRALVVFDEIVPDERDRLQFGRTRPLLTMEESGCFCDEQAASRNKDNNYDV